MLLWRLICDFLFRLLFVCLSPCLLPVENIFHMYRGALCSTSKESLYTMTFSPHTSGISGKISSPGTLLCGKNFKMLLFNNFTHRYNVFKSYLLPSYINLKEYFPTTWDLFLWCNCSNYVLLKNCKFYFIFICFELFLLFFEIILFFPYLSFLDPSYIPFLAFFEFIASFLLIVFYIYLYIN